MLLVVAVLVLAVALLALAAALYRISSNVGPLTLEEYARRNAVTLIPFSEALVSELEKKWSQPVRMRVERNQRQPILGELICTNQLEEPPAHG